MENKGCCVIKTYVYTKHHHLPVSGDTFKPDIVFFAAKYCGKVLLIFSAIF